MIYELKDMNEVERYMLTLCSKDSYLYYHKTKMYESVVVELLSKTKDKWENAVRWFVTNTARGLKHKAHAMNVSLLSNYYSKNVCGIGYRNVKSLLDLLESKGYIHIYKGFVEEWEVRDKKLVPVKAFRSVVLFRKRYLELWNDIPVDLYAKGTELELINLKTRKTKEDISLKGKAGVTNMRKEMELYNENLYSADIKFNGQPIAVVEYKREFLDNLNSCGRVFAAGGGVQLLPQRYRADFLTIDNESVVELDFSSIHPNICYQLIHNSGQDVRGILGEDFKPYDAKLDFVKVDWMLIEQHKKKFGIESYDPVRNIAKLALLVGMNCVDIEEAIGAVSQKLKNDYQKDEVKRKFVGLVSKVPVRAILEAIREHNFLIEDYFFNDYGVQLQNIDSKIASSVISTLVQLDITVLSYHDSFVTAAKHEKVLRQAMYDAWSDNLKDATFAKADKK